MSETLKLAELLGSLSYALDMTEGQPEGHCVRCCWIGVHIGRQIGLSEQAIWGLYYTLLLKDLGCSSNAARICELYLTDDQSFKRDFKLVGSNLSQVLGFVFEHTGKNESWSKRLTSILNIMRNGDAIAQELIQTRCDRGAKIARQLRFPESVVLGVHSLDEHWNGGGRPEGLRGENIPLNARIALLAQIIDVFHFSHGQEAALAEIRLRSESWFDPQLVAAFEVVASDAAFWQGLTDPNIAQAVLKLEPAQFTVPLDDQYMDEIASAFGQVVDAKSPFTAGHSERVGFYADLIAHELKLSPQQCNWIKRAALLHDVGKLGVSSSILEKPGKLSDEEFRAVQQHARLSEEILGKIAQFADLAFVAGAHHERLDGRGYPRGLSANDIRLETRIITVADIFDAISAERPYHAANSPERTLEIMRGMVGNAIDETCFKALETILERELASAQATENGQQRQIIPSTV
ncbi:HD-GYP domain-containing protein [Chitinibacter bivalviorum]|uniref:HD-GYP domain-containing protein n=1 Tax=Chitinibacter bivalviorum TaxID=2739434 RepID=A0A7H9BMR6_9NEIS|nr:HD-GYP domain-containing protein [Chitinibacter bivalviorum]QLG89381.1 HD-GYP domain-containing protein [Chitinibacter bivalviorum]